MSGRETKIGTIPGAVTQAILFGRTVREARAAGRDPVAALIGVAKGFELFRGVVSKAEMSGVRGHTYWDVEIRGHGRYMGHTYRVWVKNENIIAWLDGQVDVLPPDLIWPARSEDG